VKREGEIDFQLILEAAKMLRDGFKAPEITKQLHISSRDVAVAKGLMDMNIILFDENGEPYYTMHEVELTPIIKDLRKRKDRRTITQIISPTASPTVDAIGLKVQRQGIAQTSIASTVEERIARKAVDMTEATYRLGDAVRMHFEDYCEHLGVSPEEVRPEIIIPEIFEKAKKYDKVEKRVQELERMVYELQSIVDPFQRLEKCLDMLADFIYARAIAKKALGIDIARTGIGRFYADLIAAYLTGGVEVEGEPPTGGVEK